MATRVARNGKGTALGDAARSVMGKGVLGMVSPRRMTMGSPGEQRPGESFSRESFESSPKLHLCTVGFLRAMARL